MSKNKNLLILIFLAFSLAVFSASVYLNWENNSKQKKSIPDILGVVETSQNDFSQSQTLSASSLSTSSQQSSDQNSSASKASLSASQRSPSQTSSASSSSQESTPSRGLWENQQDAYAN